MTNSLIYPKSNYTQDSLIRVLKQAAFFELKTCSLYSALACEDIASCSEIIELAKASKKEDWDHFLLINKQLNTIDSDSTISADYFLTHNSKKLKQQHITEQSLLRELKATEFNAIDRLQKICSMTLEHDYKTFDLSYSILNENVNHQDEVSLHLKKLLSL